MLGHTAVAFLEAKQVLILKHKYEWNITHTTCLLIYNLIKQNIVQQILHKIRCLYYQTLNIFITLQNKRN